MKIVVAIYASRSSCNMGKEQREEVLCTLDSCLISFTCRAVDVKKKYYAPNVSFYFILLGYTIKIITTRQSEGQLYPPPQNDNGAASKLKVQTGGL